MRAAPVKGPGRPLPESLRRDLEASFDADLSGVAIHTESPEAAEEMGAAAFAYDRHIVFGPGRYAPETTKGKRLLAHELAHVLQQQRGGGASSAVAEADAGAAANQAASGGVANVSAGTGVGIAPRFEDEEDGERDRRRGKEDRLRARRESGTARKENLRRDDAGVEAAAAPGTRAAVAAADAEIMKLRNRGSKRSAAEKDKLWRLSRERERLVRGGQTQVDAELQAAEAAEGRPSRSATQRAVDTRGRQADRLRRNEASGQLFEEIDAKAGTAQQVPFSQRRTLTESEKASEISRQRVWREHRKAVAAAKRANRPPPPRPDGEPPAGLRVTDEVEGLGSKQAVAREKKSNEFATPEQQTKALGRAVAQLRKAQAHEPEGSSQSLRIADRPEVDESGLPLTRRERIERENELAAKAFLDLEGAVHPDGHPEAGKRATRGLQEVRFGDRRITRDDEHMKRAIPAEIERRAKEAREATDRKAAKEQKAAEVAARKSERAKKKAAKAGKAQGKKVAAGTPAKGSKAKSAATSGTAQAAESRPDKVARKRSRASAGRAVPAKQAPETMAASVAAEPARAKRATVSGAKASTPAAPAAEPVAVKVSTPAAKAAAPPQPLAVEETPTPASAVTVASGSAAQPPRAPQEEAPAAAPKAPGAAATTAAKQLERRPAVTPSAGASEGETFLPAGRPAAAKPAPAPVAQVAEPESARPAPKAPTPSAKASEASAPHGATRGQKVQAAAGAVSEALRVVDAAKQYKKLRDEGASTSEALMQTAVDQTAVGTYERAVAGGQDKAEAAVTAAATEVAGKIQIGGGPVSTAIHVVNQAAHTLGAPEGVTDATSLAAEATPSSMASQILVAGARSYYNLGKAAGGDTKGLEKLNEDMTKGGLGTPLQGYAQVAEGITDIASGDDPQQVLERLEKQSRGTAANRVGSWLADQEYKAFEWATGDSDEDWQKQVEEINRKTAARIAERHAAEEARKRGTP